jgi:Fe2+ or Zn2+ uptake regulation protein
MSKEGDARARAARNREIAGAFRVAGLRRTAQRHAVLELLASRLPHATAGELLAAVNHADPLASRATVYNALHALCDAGLVREVGGGAAARYDAVLRRHHHFLCERCGTLEDLPWFEPPAKAARRALGGRRVTSCEIVFHGLCAACSDVSCGGPAARRGER